MYRITHNSTHHLPDTAAFIETLNSPEAQALFDPQRELIVARAPGRLDVMGGIADYSGSMVLELPIRESTYVALQRDSARRLRIVSLQGDSPEPLSYEMPISDFEIDGLPVDYRIARARFASDRSQHWPAYVAGIFLVLMRERKVDFPEGARLLIGSQVPQGKGVSSSAALEVAVMQAVTAAFEITIDPREVAVLCQMAENHIAGAPCGVMDQMTAACGENNSFLALLCQPAEICGNFSVPSDLAFWGLDSGERHAITGADYGSVRVGAFMGYRIIAEMAGLKLRQTAPGEPLQIDDPKWGGYLANLKPSEFEQEISARLPERISGAEFLSRYGGTTDKVTRIDPESSYAVRVPAAHAIYEHHRVRLFAALLGQAGDVLPILGELMYQSHASYSACGLGSPGTDRLVQLVRQAGPANGLFGAKITGGGSGGTVAVLSCRDAREQIDMIARRYAEEFGYKPYIFSGSSPGSAAFGHLKLIREGA
jgi:galactokinase